MSLITQANKLIEQIETKIKPHLKDIYRLKTEGANDHLLAKYLGMTKSEFQYALENYAPLKEIYDHAMTMLCQKLSNVVIGRALGIDGKTDKEGNDLGPDHNLAMRMLEKLDPRFKDKKEVNVNVRIEDVIRNIGERVNREAIEADFEANEVIAHEEA